MVNEITEEQRAWIDERQAVITSRCEVCKGTGRTDYHPVEGSVAVLDVRCDNCDVREPLRLVARLWWENVPPAYRFATLSGLQPSEKSILPLERQARILDNLRKEPDIGYSFFGPPRTGKTVWTTALYGRALWRHILAVPPEYQKYFPILRISAKQMLDEHTAFATGNYADEWERMFAQPTVRAEKIARIRQQQGQVPRLFLEEIDKIAETDSRRNNLFEILDALKNNEGQLVLNSNLTPQEFAGKYGADLWWRINEMTKVVSLF